MLTADHCRIRILVCRPLLVYIHGFKTRFRLGPRIPCMHACSQHETRSRDDTLTVRCFTCTPIWSTRRVKIPALLVHNYKVFSKESRSQVSRSETNRTKPFKGLANLICELLSKAGHESGQVFGLHLLEVRLRRLPCRTTWRLHPF